LGSNQVVSHGIIESHFLENLNRKTPTTNNSSIIFYNFDDLLIDTNKLFAAKETRIADVDIGERQGLVGNYGHTAVDLLAAKHSSTEGPSRVDQDQEKN